MLTCCRLRRPAVRAHKTEARLCREMAAGNHTGLTMPLPCLDRNWSWLTRAHCRKALAFQAGGHEERRRRAGGRSGPSHVADLSRRHQLPEI